VSVVAYQDDDSQPAPKQAVSVLKYPGNVGDLLPVYKPA
jgi:hypothetical protein